MLAQTHTAPLNVCVHVCLMSSSQLIGDVCVPLLFTRTAVGLTIYIMTHTVIGSEPKQVEEMDVETDSRADWMVSEHFSYPPE